MTDQQKTAQTMPLIQEGAVYFNAVTVANGPGDVVFTLVRNGQPFLTLNTPYAVAKLLARALTAAVQSYEKIAEHEVLDQEDLAKRMTEATK